MLLVGLTVCAKHLADAVECFWNVGSPVQHSPPGMLVHLWAPRPTPELQKN